jgi:hypothetical protein
MLGTVPCHYTLEHLLFRIEFPTANAAFDNEAEVEYILKNIIDRVKYGSPGGKVMDSFGNSIGEWSLTDE